MIDATRKRAIEDLRELLTNYTECEVQGSWPCGTCTTDFLTEIGVREDGEHNDDVDRVNEVWRAILQIRGGIGV